MECSKTYNIIIVSLLLACFSLKLQAAEETPGNAIMLKQKGNVCYEAGRYADALNYYTEGMKKAKEEKDEKAYYACIGNIGNIYGELGDIRRALHYYKKGYQMAVDAGDTETQWKFCTNLVAVCCLMKDSRNARNFFNIQMKIPIKDITSKRYYFLSNQAMIAHVEGNFKMEDYYHNMAVEYVKSSNMPVIYLVSQFQEIGKSLLERGKAKEALTYFAICRDSLLTAKSGAERLTGVYKNMSDAYKQAGDTARANEMKGIYLRLSDSIFNKTQMNFANNSLFEYENNEAKHQIEDLTRQNRSWIIIIIVFAILMTGISLLYIALRGKNRTLISTQRFLIDRNKELEQAEHNAKTLLEQYISAIKPEAQISASAPSCSEDGNDAENDTVQKANTMLDDVQKSILLNKIVAVMEDTETISKHEFCLDTLAKTVKSNTKYVSLTINDTYGKNFKTLLNEYRIREATRRMADTEAYGNMTIQALYQDLGYNSAASFIQAFKNVNGMTPSAYMKVLKFNRP